MRGTPRGGHIGIFSPRHGPAGGREPPGGQVRFRGARSLDADHHGVRHAETLARKAALILKHALQHQLARISDSRCPGDGERSSRWSGFLGRSRADRIREAGRSDAEDGLGGESSVQRCRFREAPDLGPHRVEDGARSIREIARPRPEDAQFCQRNSIVTRTFSTAKTEHWI